MSDTITAPTEATNLALFERWNAQSITGGLATDTTPNATVDDQPVIAVWVEDCDSDEWARTYECFFADGSVECVPPEDVEFGEDD
jgi:hypothetical protein